MVAPLKRLQDPAPEAVTGGSSRRSTAAPPSASRGALGTWLTPSAVAKATGGDLLARGRSADGVVTDSRLDCKGNLFVALRGPSHDGHDHAAAALQKGARGVVVDRAIDAVPGLAGSPGFVVRVGDTGEALLRLAGEHRRRHRAKVVGITGSCGKTTTKEWLGSVLERAMNTVRSPGSFNNRVGVPLTLFRIGPETRAAVVEIGTSAPGEIGTLAAIARPDIAIVTCVAAAHLQGLGSIDGVAREKALLPASLGDDGLCILNGDDVACREMAGVTRADVKFVSIDNKDVYWHATDLRFHAFGTSFKLRDGRPVTLPRLGTHNVYNALFVLAAADALGVPEDVAVQALCEVPPAARRLEPKCAAGITVFDDTYNMNPESARAGLQAIAGTPGPGRRFVVFGEMLELGAASEALHRQLGNATGRAGIDGLIAVGQGARPIAEGALAVGMPAGGVHCVDAIGDAQTLLLQTLRPGDRVLCKASRRVGLDRLVDALLNALGGRGPCPEGAPEAPETPEVH